MSAGNQMWPGDPARYPAHWGRPQGEPHSEQRAAWVRRQVDGDPKAALRKVQRRSTQTAREWLVEHVAKRYRRT